MAPEEEPAEKATQWIPRSLFEALAEQEIRIDGVARGLTWTPLIPSTFLRKMLPSFLNGPDRGKT